MASVELTAECQTMSGDWKPSRLDLNACISTIDGEMRWQQNGRFGDSSKEIRLDTPPILTAKCRNKAGVYCDSSINLDDRIGNIDGELRFSG